MTRIAAVAAFLRSVFSRRRPRECGTSCACAAQRPKFTLANLPRGTHVEIGERTLRLGRLRSDGTLRAAEERRPDGTYSPETWIDLVSHERTAFVVVSSRALALRVKEGDLSG